MALPGSGTITWEMIRAEFGGGRPVYAHQYYRGGGLVPDTPSNARVPTGGAISAWHFYGTVRTPPLNGSAAGGSSAFNLGMSNRPITRAMSAGTSASASGGSGSYSYAWSITGSSGVSGASISPNGSSATVSATATLNNLGWVAVQCIISDGATSVVVTARVDFNYYNTV